MNMNIVFQSSDLYSKYLRVTMLSIMKNSDTTDYITFHILSDGIAHSNITLIKNTLTDLKRFKIIFYDMEFYKKKLEKYVPKFHGSISTYLKLFIAEILPKDIKKVLYLDVDILVLKSLKDLFLINMGTNYMMGVQTLLNKSNSKNFFINGGVLLINLDKCRNDNVSDIFINEIIEQNAKLHFADQSVIHNTISNQIGLLDLKYNIVTPCFLMNYRRFKFVYNLSNYYSKEIYENAQKNPVICHCTEWVVGRPWTSENCNPHKKYYHDLMKELNIAIEKPNFYFKFIYKIKKIIYLYIPEKLLNYHLVKVRKISQNKGVID